MNTLALLFIVLAMLIVTVVLLKIVEGNPALMNLRLMQPFSTTQNAGNTLVLGLPGFMPLRNGKAGSPQHRPEDGAS